MKVGIALGNPGKAGRAFVGEAVQDLSLVEHGPVAFFLLRRPLEVRVSAVVGRVALGWKEVGFVQNGYGRIYGADTLHMLSFERYSDRDGKFISRHSVHHTEWRLGY
ncbi:hypothetical protein StoSoilB13_11360 [Arthrobacter sp. StoSoilB13]|nr:hypothetical protein StoSoilB13_11360 [Arthrobacter sp. StoSoilB13]